LIDYNSTDYSPFWALRAKKRYRCKEKPPLGGGENSGIYQP